VKKRRQKSFWKGLRYAVFLLLLYILQGLVFSHFKIFGYVPMLFSTAVVGVALYDTLTTAATFGLFAGILCDVSANETAALFTVLFTVLAVVVKLLSESVLTRSPVTFCAASLAALLLCAFVQMFYLLFFVGADGDSLMKTAGAQTLISLIFLLPIYPAVRFLSRQNA
jgi:hypothetical protein